MDVFLLVIGCAVTCLSTAIGALPVMFLYRINEKARDVLMGFSAGIMLAAASFSLLLPALHLGEAVIGSEKWTAVWVALALFGRRGVSGYLQSLYSARAFYLWPRGAPKQSAVEAHLAFCVCHHIA